MTKRFINSLLLLILVCALTSCGIHTIRSELNIPSQSLDIKAPPGLTKVIIFNDSNMLTSGLDGSAKINLKLNGKAVGSINIREYVQVFVSPGSYDMHMAHFDLLTFESDHKLNISGEEVYIKIYSRPTSNAYEIVNTLPTNFLDKYKPIKTM